VGALRCEHQRLGERVCGIYAAGQARGPRAEPQNPPRHTDARRGRLDAPCVHVSASRWTRRSLGSGRYWVCVFDGRGAVLARIWVRIDQLYCLNG